jgi:hypothetical protein
LLYNKSVLFTEEFRGVRLKKDALNLINRDALHPATTHGIPRGGNIMKG